MWEWIVRLHIPDELSPEQEDALLEAISENIDWDQIKAFVEEKLESFGFVEVEVQE
jgi:hypothetical protein